MVKLNVSQNPFGWGNIDRFFDDFLTAPAAEPVGFNPSFDIEETESHFVLSFDVPGVSRDDLNLSVEGNTLTVSGERKLRTNQENVHHLRRSFGQFKRSFSLPEGVDVDQIEAEYRDGVLQVGIPKAEKSKPRTVEIKPEGKGFFQKLLNTEEKV